RDVLRSELDEDRRRRSNLLRPSSALPSTVGLGLDLGPPHRWIKPERHQQCNEHRANDKGTEYYSTHHTPPFARLRHPSAKEATPPDKFFNPEFPFSFPCQEANIHSLPFKGNPSAQRTMMSNELKAGREKESCMRVE